ncbi:MAG TPA: nuclear transport factor 2 family protein [Rudaea sp.]|nr:nuclear transport factor 2 family protein [Rudaea sp.]
MVSKIAPWSFVLNAVVVFSAGAAPASSAPAENAHVAKPTGAAPTVHALLALEKQAHEAYVKGDGKFFDSLLGDKFVEQRGGIRVSKADVVKHISGVKCEVNAGWALTEPQLLKIDNDAYVLTYVSNMQGSCAESGKTEKMPSPVRAATVWIRNGGRWQVVFHGENPIVDPSAPLAIDKKAEVGNDVHTAANIGSAHKVTSDPITDALLVVDNAVEDGWMRHDAEKIKAETAKDIAFVDIYGTFSADKSATVKAWTSTLCEVSGYKITNGVGTSVSPTVGILTLTGAYTGTCGGQDIGELKVFVNEVYVKVDGVWKWVFGFNSLT